MRSKHINIVARDYKNKIAKSMKDINSGPRVITVSRQEPIASISCEYINEGFKILERYYRMRGYRVNTYSFSDSGIRTFFIKIYTFKLTTEEN